MCKIEQCVKIEKSGRGRPERGVVLEIRTHPDKGRGWFENPRFWRTSFVDGPLRESLSGQRAAFLKVKAL